MLVRTYRSPMGREFLVHRQDDDSLTCTCKEFRFHGQRTCRHIWAFLTEPNPFDSIDWL